MNPADVRHLQEIYRRICRSLLQYARGAALYAGPDRNMLDGVLRIAAEQQTAADQFADYLDQKRVPIPFPGSYPMRFTDLNFVTVRSLIPRLVEEERTAAATLETDQQSLEDSGARAAVQALATTRRKHLGELEALAGLAG